MRNFIFLALLFSAACQNLEGNYKNAENNEAKEETPARDMTITAANAYSDLFLDSAALEQFISRQQLDGGAAQQIRNFYNRRNFQFAWFASDGFTEQGRGLWNLYNESDTTQQNKSAQSEKKLRTLTDSLMTEDSLRVSAQDSGILATELFLTRQFIQMAARGANALVVPTKKASVVEAADSLLNADVTAAPAAYNQLRDQLKKYRQLVQDGGWPAVNATAVQLRKGTSNPAVVQLKKRLQATGELQGNDTSAVYDNRLDSAVRTFQQRVGMKPDGRITDTLLSKLNIPAEQRLQQIIVNMNRMLWAPQQQGNVLEVNIPSFMLYAYEGGRKAFEMPVVVGKEGTNTMMFTGDLNQIVFSPYWNIPASIVREEILPAMKKDPGYLRKNNMEIVKEGDSLPVMRQLPGPENSLGKVKFLFPNSFDIYFHDTPAKGLFQRENRAFSHGCIRLADAKKMAVYLLRDNPDWTEDKIVKAMDSGKEQYVKLKNPVPVRINYYTAWVDDSGQLNFRDDIYGHDQKSAGKMFL